MCKNGKKICCTNKPGAALLVVLFLVMVATILSLSFLSRSDVELACGENMTLREQMDYLAESGLEHAKGLLLNPQDVSSEYWTGASGQQLYSGQDYYDVNVVKISDCNYQITSCAYRMKGSEQIGRSLLIGELRFNPAIAFCVDSNTTVSRAMTITGDVNCKGTLTNGGVINGDVFAGGLSGTIAGQCRGTTNLSLSWPRITAPDFTSATHYSVQNITDASLNDVTMSGTTQVYYRSGSLVLAGNVKINGMLVVNGDLTIRGNGNVITARKNLPAILVTGNTLLDSGGRIDVNGLVVINGQMQIVTGAAGLNVVGGLFVKNGVIETTPDSSVWGNTAILYNNPLWQPTGGQTGGAFDFDGTNDYLQTGDDANKLQLTGDYTLSVWIKANASQNIWAGIFSSTDRNGSLNHWTLQFDNSSPQKLVVHHPVTSWDTDIRLNTIAGSWHNIKVIRKGNSMKSYLDGTKIKDNSWAEAPGSGNGHLNIGVDRIATSGCVYKGLIDEVRIYNRAPDGNDPLPPDASLAGYWRLDGSSGNMTITAAPLKAAVFAWSAAGVAEKWSPAPDAFFRGIRRN